jgi:hypothetical protein
MILTIFKGFPEYGFMPAIFKIAAVSCGATLSAIVGDCFFLGIHTFTHAGEREGNLGQCFGIGTVLARLICSVSSHPSFGFGHPLHRYWTVVML